MKIPQLARYNGTVLKAYEFVEKNVTEFPVDLFEIIKKSQWGLLTYEDLAVLNNCTVEDVCQCFGKDGYSIYNGNNYSIAYNSTKKYSARVRFTLAHEIGHIVLNHHRDFNVTTVMENNFSREEYKILENEANCFARNLLSPVPLVKTLSLNEYYFKMSNFFGLSFQAVKSRISLYKNDLYYLDDEHINQMQKKYLRYNICRICSLYPLPTTFKYCPRCGHNKFILGDVFTMKRYSGINIEEMHECPRCENFDIQPEHSYCKICGLKFKNECISCHTALDSDARYCTSCGALSSYFQSGILKNWTEDTDATEENNTEFLLSSGDELPF